MKLAQQSYKFDVIQQIEQDGDIAGLNVPYEFPRNELHILEGPKSMASWFSSLKAYSLSRIEEEAISSYSFDFLSEENG